MTTIDLDYSTLDQTKLDDLTAYIDSLEHPEESLIHVLHRAQKLFGYIPYNVQFFVAKTLKIGAARVNGVVSFYSFFNEQKPGKYTISVCMGTACYVRGAEKVLQKLLEKLEINKGDVTEDGLFSVKDVRCIGACGLAPVVTVGEKVYGHATEDMALDIIDKYRGDLDGN
ncbi:MAG: NAD(P)H-dependent oxidoreductase subunit E [Candidatus Izimaplasma sp.]|nr:NAD(P)H-dependent oxidoreductase subunit E [Candidatus Izimaplasma bacterium]